jgi:sialate O-acetylesterase
MTRNLRAVALGLLVAGLLCAAASAAVTLPKIFADSMVLQRGAPVPVWGLAAPGETVTVSFAGQQKSAAADANGKWRVTLDALDVSKEPRELVVKGANALTIKDVLVGEVWLCSGQSNMAWTVSACLNAAAEIAEAKDTPTIRHYQVPRVDATRPLADVPGRWSVATPDTVGGYTAVGYFFARELTRALDVPVGIINSSWGGTRIEPWTCPEGFRAVPELKETADLVDGWDLRTETGRRKYSEYLTALKTWLPTAEAALIAGKAPPAAPVEPVSAPGNTQPTRLYNGMIAPIAPFAIAGAIWYQGEANGSEGVTYYHKLRALIAGWRQVWGQGDFPFGIVQLTSYTAATPNSPEGGTGWARIREAQMQALAIPNTGLACTIDIGEATDIHPKNKQDVGARLARWAIARVYAKNLLYSGPIYKGMTVEGGKARITFTFAESGLMIAEKKGLPIQTHRPDAKLGWLAIAGKDKVWHWADAVIEGSTLAVSSDKVAQPVAVRYAFTPNPEGPKLYSQDGLPVLPFRTDAW